MTLPTFSTLSNQTLLRRALALVAEVIHNEHQRRRAAGFCWSRCILRRCVLHGGLRVLLDGGSIMADMTRELHTTLRSEAARACRLSRLNKGVGDLGHWYEGRYLAYKQSAALLQIALGHDDWRKANGY